MTSKSLAVSIADDFATDASSPGTMRATLQSNSFSNMATLANMRKQSGSNNSINIAVDDPIFAARIARAASRPTVQAAAAQISELPLPPDDIQKQYQKQAESLKQEAKDAKKEMELEKDWIKNKINKMLGKGNDWK